jgi:hypothetical protein
MERNIKLSVEPVPFEHIIIDLSLRGITTSKGEVVTLCQIDTNTPLTYHGEMLGGFYSWGKIVEAGNPLEFVCGPFCFIVVKNCGGHDMGVFAVAHTVPDEPTFQALVYEDDELVTAECSDVSVNLKASFDFAWFSAGQRLRIETIPDLETHDNFRVALWKSQEKKEQQETPNNDE